MLRSPLLLNRNVTNFFRKWSRRIGNALLPSFASFLLLSYTKFSITSSSLVRYIELDGERRLYFAAQYRIDDSRYFQFIPGALILCTFVAITPILLLDLPLRGIEWIVGKSVFLTRIYPSTEIHILLDTFQGCYKKNARFFAGIYFLFRFVVNLGFVFSSTWTELLVINQITVTVMILLLTYIKPYRPKLNYVNYVDIFIFSILAIQNCFTFFLFVTYKIDPNDRTPKYRVYFYIQYVAVFLPLIYMMLFIMWKNRRVMKILSNIFQKVRSTRHSRIAYERLSLEEESSILRRAEDPNQYQHIRRVETNRTEDKNDGNSTKSGNISKANEHQREEHSKQYGTLSLSDGASHPLSTQSGLDLNSRDNCSHSKTSDNFLNTLELDLKEDTAHF